MNKTAQAAKTRAARISIASNSALVAMKLGVGLSMQSVSVVSEAVHSGLDLVAAVIAYLSIRHSAKPADEEHQYGHGKVENLAATMEAALIFGAAVYILYESLNRLVLGVEGIEGLGLGTVVMAISAGANYLVSSNLFKVARQTDSAALEADALHLRTDVYTSLGVVGGLIAIKLTGLAVFDPIVAIVVALLIIKSAWALAKDSLHHMLDKRLPLEDEEVIRGVLLKYKDRFCEYHKLRTRKSGPVRHIDLHLVVPGKMTVAEGHSLSDAVTGEIMNHFANSHVLVHIEPCEGGCEICGPVDSGQGSAV